MVKLPRVIADAVGKGLTFILFPDFLEYKAKVNFYFLFYKKYDEFIVFKKISYFMLLHHSYM